MDPNNLNWRFVNLPSFWCFSLALFVMAASQVQAGLVINEILVDPEGSDSGREFVELINSGSETVDLQGVEFQFGNGADGPQWKTRWTGSAGMSINSGEYFLIVDRNWLAEEIPNSEVYLGLQNGPDAVRLIRGELILDMVGYGPLTDQLMMETQPASVVTGKSMSRRPDGSDTHNNMADFVAAKPTPGSRNFEPWSLLLKEIFLDPPSLGKPGQGLKLEVSVQNNGTNTIPDSLLELTVGREKFRGRLEECQPDNRKTVTWHVYPNQWGSLSLSLLVLLPAVPDTLKLDLGKLQVGPGDLFLNEVLAAPNQGQKEWIELRSGPVEIQLGDYSIRDEDGAWRALPELILEKGGIVVVAQDSSSLANWLNENQQHGGLVCGPGQASSRILNLGGGWPSLNNSSSSSREFADRVYLADLAGSVIDHLTWGGTGFSELESPETGRSLERIADRPGNPVAGNWAESTSVAGSTPCCPNSIFQAGERVSSFSVDPRVLDPGQGISTIHVRFSVDSPATGSEVFVHDLWGGLIRNLGGDRHGSGPRDFLWNGLDNSGEPVPTGGYIVSMRTLGKDGHTLDRFRVLVAVRQVIGR